MLFLSSTDFIARSAPLQLAPSAQDCQRDLTTKHTNRTARILETTKHTKAPLACQACVFLTQGRKSFSVAHLARKKNLSSESFFRKDADGAPSACLRRFSRVARSCTLRRTGTYPCSDSVRCAGLVCLSDARPFVPLIPLSLRIKSASPLACSVSVHCWTDFKTPFCVVRGF